MSHLQALENSASSTKDERVQIAPPFTNIGLDFTGPLYRAPVAQLIEHRSVTREVVSSTPVGPTLRVLK